VKELRCALLLLAAALAGCTAENAYEGLKTREAVTHPLPDSPPRSGLPPYHDYEAERKKLLEGKK
jgi:hypothetical protein